MNNITEEKLRQMSKEELVELLKTSEKKMRELVGSLHEEFCFTGLATEQQWNESIAPRLKDLALVLEGEQVGTITPRVYKFPVNV